MDGGTRAGTGALFLLAAELEGRGFTAEGTKGDRNVLRVTAQRGSGSGLVAYQAGKFWWQKTQEPVGPSGEIRAAADEIARVLGAAT